MEFGDVPQQAGDFAMRTSAAEAPRAAQNETLKSDQPVTDPQWQPGAAQLMIPFPDTPEVEFDDAFARAQANFQPIVRNRTVKVAMKAGGTYTYEYAELATILAATVPYLNAERITFRQRLIASKDGDQVETILKRRGYSERSLYPVFSVNIADPKDLGAQVTYAKRLGAQLALGVASEDDNDGSDKEFAEPPQRGGFREKVQRAMDEYLGPAAESRDTFMKPDSKTNATRLVDADAAPVSDAATSTDYTPAQLADMEGRIVDARDELLQAAAEGRRVGIEQIWNEIKDNEYVATRVWSQLREHPDHFATIKTVLKPKPQGKRDPNKARG
jgi:hypothetical protein